MSVRYQNLSLVLGCQQSSIMWARLSWRFVVDVVFVQRRTEGRMQTNMVYQALVNKQAAVSAHAVCPQIVSASSG